MDTVKINMSWPIFSETRDKYPERVLSDICISFHPLFLQAEVCSDSLPPCYALNALPVMSCALFHVSPLSSEPSSLLPSLKMISSSL